MSILESCEDCKMSEREIFWIKELKTFIKDPECKGYNMTCGGEALFGDNNPFYGKKHTEESKQKMSNAAKQRTGDKNPFFNKQHSDETKEKIRQANLGRKHTKEELEKMSKSQIGENNHFFWKETYRKI